MYTCHCHCRGHFQRGVCLDLKVFVIPLDVKVEASLLPLAVKTRDRIEQRLETICTRHCYEVAPPPSSRRTALQLHYAASYEGLCVDYAFLNGMYDMSTWCPSCWRYIIVFV
ncbi:hypothetical protein NA56DRAFT_243921 [Hyaloscypha hepaticicola]|uniref:Uncharacterized protein n=1 Tax=Hyaloscypha hepaticicola TaxID=2082293 RepID=A0A2J6PWN1_9HELO|nr:hypothetical protein NA56DRAFT_243921 [Hyaloscypha hepaticicola]